MERRFLIMPGYVTHYIFGREVYHNLKNNSLKKNLYYNRAAYGLGLQGPDIFLFILIVCHGINIRMTYCIQGIVPEKTNQVGFCNVKIRAGGKLVTAFNQTQEKGTGLADMGKSTDIVTF